MTAAVTPAKWMIKDSHRIIDAGILDNHHVELSNGEIVEMSPEAVPAEETLTLNLMSAGLY